VILATLVCGATLQHSATISALQAPTLALDDHPFLRPGVAAVHDAVVVSRELLTRHREQLDDALGATDRAGEAFALAQRVERGQCAREDLVALEEMIHEVPLVDAMARRTSGSLHFIEAETFRCLGARLEASRSYVHAAALNPRLASVAAYRHRQVSGADTAPIHADTRRGGVGIVEIWRDASRDRGDAALVLAGLDDLDAAQASRWMAEELDQAWWSLRDLPEAAAQARTHRVAWVLRHTDRAAWWSRAQALLRCPQGQAAAVRDPRVLDVILDAAREDAHAMRTSAAIQRVDVLLAAGLLSSAEAADVDTWIRSRARASSATYGRLGHAELGSMRDTGWGRGAAEAAWDRILYLRREDRDAEAAEAVDAFLRRFPEVRSGAAWQACVVLRGHLGHRHRQVSCWREGLVRGVWDDPVWLAADVIVDALAFADHAAAAEITREVDAWAHGLTVPLAEMVPPRSHVRYLYWRARTRALTGDRAEAIADFRRVRELAPIDYYGWMADAQLGALGERSRFAAMVATWSTRREGFQVEPVGVAGAELLGVGFHGLARQELMVQAQLYGSDAPVTGALAALAFAENGEVEQSIWIALRRVELQRSSAEAISRMPSAMWRAAYPLHYGRALRTASDATGVDRGTMLAFIRRESAFDAQAVSRVGARGLVQIRPATARRYAANVPEIDSVSRSVLNDPMQNVRLGAEMMADLLGRYDGCIEPVAAGYASGPGRAAAWDRRHPSRDNDIWVERIPYPAVREYARDIASARAVYAVLLGDPLPQALCALPDPGTNMRRNPHLVEDTADEAHDADEDRVAHDGSGPG